MTHTVIIRLQRDIILRYPQPQSKKQVLESLADQILWGIHDEDFTIQEIPPREG